MTNQNMGQGYVAGANSAGNDDSVSTRYALLTRLAELDLELAKNGTAVGMAVELLFPEETTGFTSVAAAAKQR